VALQVVGALGPLRATLRGIVAQRCVRSICDEARASYSILWEDTTAQVGPGRTGCHVA
jgi:type II secretory ATPase GspE/PulE/Tfp pilus assembly ATPase PilB-like protein